MSCDILGPLRITEDDEVMRVNANQTKESKERKKDDVVVGVWIDSVGWRCSVNVFVFRRRYCSHRKHKFIVWPTMASNWLEVVQNYNYITRATKKKKKPQVLTKYGEKEEEEGKKTNMCPSAGAVFIRRFVQFCTYLVPHWNGVMRWCCSAFTATQHHQTIFTYRQSLCFSHFVRYAIRNLCFAQCSGCGGYDGNRSNREAISRVFFFSLLSFLPFLFFRPKVV